MKIPKIFYTLSHRSNKLEKITTEDVQQYVSSLQEDTTFLPEVIEIIGIEDFLTLVSFLGGQKICLPTPEKLYKELLAQNRGENNG